VTQTPVNFWWSEEGVYLYYEKDQRVWQYDPVTSETVDVTSETPIYGCPSPSVQARIPDQAPEYNVHFSPSGVQALYVLESYTYEDGTPISDIDGELSPSEPTSEIWYITEKELKPRQIGTVSGTIGIATWSQDEDRAFLPILDNPFSSYSHSGWMITLPDGQMWRVSVVSDDRANSIEWYIKMASDGQKALFVGCALGLGKEECEYWFTDIEEDSIGHSEPIDIPFDKWNIRLLPDNRGLIAFDGVVIYLYGFADGTWLQLNDTYPPYTRGSVPMYPPDNTMRAVKFSSDLHYIAWNGSRGLQVFSLCPGAGELLNCES